MTPEQITEIREYIKTDLELKALAEAGCDNDIVLALATRTETIIDTAITIGSRWLASILDVDGGENFIQAMEDFTIATLPDEHPMKKYQKGLIRQLKWLDREAGLEVGNERTRAMLDAFVQLGILDAGEVALVKALAEKTVSALEAKGWLGLNNMDVAQAVRSSTGESLLGA